MSDDGHLYLSARGGVEYAGDSRHSWYDDAHRSVLVLSPRSHKLREIALDASLDVEGRIGAVRVDRKDARSRSDEDDEDNEDEDDEDDGGGEDKIRQQSASHCGVTVVYDFAAQYYHAEDTASGRSGHVVAEKEGSMEPVALMKLSLDKQFLAVQTSDIEVQVIRLATREKFWIMCKPNAGNRILTDGIVWNVHASTPDSSQDLFLITKMGIEQYRVSIKRRNCALHRSIGVYIHAFWYAASHGVLIISTGSRANEIVPYLLRGSSVEKLPRLVFSTSVGKNDLYLAPLYGQLYAVYGDTRSTKLLLYLVERNKVSCTRSLNLLLPPGTALEYSVVDNLLVCHSLDFNVSLFFDIKCDGNVSDPFSHPLPISLRAPAHDSRLLSPSSSSSEELPVHDIESMDGETIDTLTEEESSYPSSSSSKHHIRRARSADGMRLRLTFDDENAQVLSVDDDSTLAQQSGDTRKKVARLERAMTTMHMGKMDHHQFEMNGHYFSRWRFLPPNLVQRSFSVKGRKDLMEQVEVRKLQVNLRGICRSSARHREVFPFLLRRGDQMLAKTLVLKLVYDTLQEDDLSLPAVVNLFNAVQTMTHDDLDQGVADESPNDTSSDEERSVSTRSAASSSLLSHRDLAPQRSSSFRTRGFSENMSKSGGGSGHVPSMPSRNAHGFLLIYQSEFCHQVWSALLPDSMITRNGKLSVYLSEFIKNLRGNMVPVENLTYVALARSFLAADQPGKLYQFLHHDISSDSTELADLLVQHGKIHHSLLQLGLDMHFRLGAITPLVLALLECGEVDRAIAISWRNMRLNSYDASVISASYFYNSMIDSIWATRESSSSFQVAQRLRKLLLFLKVWDPASIERPQGNSVSTLVKSASAEFPECFLDPAAAKNLKAAFGFSQHE